jgi:hypothetical protein
MSDSQKRANWLPLEMVNSLLSLPLITGVTIRRSIAKNLGNMRFKNFKNVVCNKLWHPIGSPENKRILNKREEKEVYAF